MSAAQAAAELLRRRNARVSAKAFAEVIDVPGRPAEEDDEDDDGLQYEIINSDLAPHHKLICDEAEACFLKPYGRTMLFMPPGSAKSTYASVVVPAYVMGKYEKTRVGLFSYGSSLAKKFGRRTRSIVTQPRYTAIMQGVKMVATNGAANEFGLTNGSEYMATGILGAATGNRFNFLIIDDPVKGREDADSEALQVKTWDAYEDDLKTRLIPGGSMMIIMCMTGDTSVSMADGSNKLLSDVRQGDMVASHHEGRIVSSKVMNWIDQGPDDVYEIRMRSDIIVKANERHPFLVQRQGAQEWVRLKNLKVGDQIVRVMQNGESGSALSAPMRDAESLQNPRECVYHTTTNVDGQMACGHHQQTQTAGEQHASSIDTAYRMSITTQCLQTKDACAPSANNHLEAIPARTGAGNSALTTTTPQGKYGHCFATIATSPLVTERTPTSLNGQRNTYEITLDTVESVTPVGRQNVFDIQVEGTENFIANGLVSHNTRWNEGDIAGRILPESWNGESGDILCKDKNVWRVVCLQAECETDTDPLGRKRGEWLWPEWFKPQHWEQFKHNSRTWGALCQQLPRPADGNLFKPDMIEVIDVLPAGRITWVRGWDMAATEGGGDWTVGLLLGRHQDGFFIIADIVRAQLGPDKRDKLMQLTAKSDGKRVIQDYPQDPGQAGKSQVLAWVKNLVGYIVKFSPESGDKETRASPAASQVNGGNFKMMRADWNDPLKKELRPFPHGTYKDQGDALGRAFNRLLEMAGKMQINQTLLDRMKS